MRVPEDPAQALPGGGQGRRRAARGHPGSGLALGRGPAATRPRFLAQDVRSSLSRRGDKLPRLSRDYVPLGDRSPSPRATYFGARLGIAWPQCAAACTHYDLNGRVALITGGARGIGLATAKALTARGARVALVDLDSDDLKSAAAHLGPDTLAIPADVTDQQRSARP